MRKKIRTIDNYGSGSEENGIESGHAGSAFLARVITNVCKQYNCTLNEKNFALACAELEEHLINEKELIDEEMKDYTIDPESSDLNALDPLFSLIKVNDYEVNCSHLYKAFEEINANALKNALDQISGVDKFDLQNTKIVFVGGFSNFFALKIRLDFILTQNLSLATQGFLVHFHMKTKHWQLQREPH